MINSHLYSEEGRAKKLGNGGFALLFALSIAIGLTAAYLNFKYITYEKLTPYQKMYFPQFRSSFIKQYIAFRKDGSYILLTYARTDPKTKQPTDYLWQEKDINFELDENERIKFNNQNQPILSIKPGVFFEPGKSKFAPANRPHALVYKALKDVVYESEIYELFYWSSGIGFTAFLVSLIAFFSLTNANVRRKLKGIFKRGMRQLPVDQYSHLVKKNDGFYLKAEMPDGDSNISAKNRLSLRRLVSTKSAAYHLRIPRADEAKGTMLLGDSGTGKTQLQHQLIACARSVARSEPGVCYDPASEFVQTHYEDSLDYILNPFDDRFPNWELRSEIKTTADLDLIAESFFPSRYVRDNQTKFFNRAAQDVFKLVLAHDYSNREIVKILSQPALIDALVKDTEVAHKIDPKAGPQRAGVLASLADAATLLKNIPPPRPERKPFSLTSWTQSKRRSWLFFTMTSETRDSVRPFVSVMLNILMRRLMSIPKKQRENDAWWFVADELHTLNALPALPDFVAECRKHGIRYILGTQSKYQLTLQYGDEAKMILAQAKLKIYFRCNEAEGATWVSQNIGNEEIERPQISVSVPTGAGAGRDSINVHNITENRVLFNKEQIMSLPDLHAIWKFEDKIVPFKLVARKWEENNPEFVPIPRQILVHPKPPVETKSNNIVSIPPPVVNEQPTSTTALNPEPHIINQAEKPVVKITSADEDLLTLPALTDEPPDYSNEIQLDF